MSKVRILIIEDELLVAQEMKAMLESYGYTVADVVDNAIDARRALEMYQLDMVLIDIKIKGDEDGIGVAEFINRQYKLPLIFITSHADQITTDRAMQAHPCAYLVKPYNERELQIAIDLAMFNFERQQVADPTDQRELEHTHYLFNQHVFVRDNHRFERLDFADILWMKAESSYVSIVTDLKNYLLTSDTLGSMLEKINCAWLLRVHRSYAVNINMVQAIDGNQLSVNKQTIPIGKNYRSSIKQYFNII